jgi:hypothetical protein
MLGLGPGPPSLLHLTRANAEKPYAGDTVTSETINMTFSYQKQKCAEKIL